MSLEKKRDNRILEKINKGVWMAALAAIVMAMTGLSNHNTLCVKADENIPAGRKFECVEWNKVYGEAPISGKNFIGMLQFSSNGETYYTAGSSFSGNKWVCQNISRDPYICSADEADTFLTSNFEGAPYFQANGTDGDNGHGPKFKIYFSDFAGKISRNGLYISTEDLYSNDDPDKWTFLTQGTTSKRSVSKGYWYIFYNRSWDRDSHLEYSGDKIKAEKDGGWPGDFFQLLKAEYKTYAAIADFTVQKDQVLRVANDVFQLDNTTITVEDGAVLSIAGKFLYNGSIDIKGTVIVQKDAVMIPYLPDKKSSRCGNIILRDGGTLIIMDGAKVYTGIPGGCMGTDASCNGVFTGLNGNVINFGMFCSGNSYFTKDFVFENHSGAKIILGASSNTKCGKVFNKYQRGQSLGYYGLSKVGRKMNNPQMYYKWEEKANDPIVDPKGTPTIKSFNGSKFEVYNDYYSFDTYSYDASGKMTFREGVIY